LAALPTLPGDLQKIVQITGASGDAAAATASGDPVGIGTGGVTKVSAVLDVGSLKTTTTSVVDAVGSQLGNLLGLLPNDPVVDLIKTALGGVLETIKGNREVLAVELGASTAKSSSAGNTVTGLANTAALKIGLLPFCPLEQANDKIQETASCVQSLATDPHFLDPLKYGLLIIDVTVGEAKASWDGKSGPPSLSGTAANVKIRERDLSKVGDPLTTSGAYKDVVNLDLKAQPLVLPEQLQTTIDVASVKTEGETVTVDALKIHALKGLGASPTGAAQTQATDGGILLQVGNLTATAHGEVPTSVLGLPKTGGMRIVFYTVAALLVVGAPLIYLLSRRLRRTP
jgi:hypothetical protein